MHRAQPDRSTEDCSDFRSQQGFPPQARRDRLSKHSTSNYSQESYTDSNVSHDLLLRFSRRFQFSPSRIGGQ
jgi:hypothetical protein